MVRTECETLAYQVLARVYERAPSTLPQQVPGIHLRLDCGLRTGVNILVTVEQQSAFVFLFAKFLCCERKVQ